MNKDDYKKAFENLITKNSYTECKFPLWGYSSASFSKPEAFAMLCLLYGVKDISSHIQYHSGNKKRLESLMVWNNNLVVKCASPKHTQFLYKILTSFASYSCGYIQGNTFGIGSHRDDASKLMEIIVAFHSFKSDFHRIMKLIKT